MSALDPLRRHFRSGATRPLEARLSALKQLEALIEDNKDAICDALWADLRKPKSEALISEIAVVLDEIRAAQKDLPRWMKPVRKRTPLPLWPSKSRTHFEPLGVVLVIGPWNYPFQLTICPLVGAIAAGNCAVVKPSELAPATSALIAQLAPNYFQSDYIQVVEGGIPETTELLSQKFDHIFFTGSTSVGRIVMQAAAKNLTPVTLELGGKSPVIVDKAADLDLAARRIVWGKFYNAGQTCVAPDYLYVHSEVRDELVEKLKTSIEIQFGSDPWSDGRMSRIINLKNCQRLERMIDPDKVIYGGNIDLDKLTISPTLLQGVSWNDAVMQEEIFGPLLPILEFEDINQLFEQLTQREKPLAAYLFTTSEKTANSFVNRVSFGGGCINDVVVHVGNLHLPFGGVGESGIGAYHGEQSFFTFSHAKSVMYRTGLLDTSARYSPHDSRKLKFLRWIFRV